MPRGGKRPGAGRNHKLDLCERIWIATEYIERWNALAQKQASERIDARYARWEVADDLATMNEVPPGEPRRLMCELADREPDTWPDDVSDIVRDGAEALRNRKTNLAKKRPVESVRTPQGARERIEAEVAVVASERYGISITSDYVRRCIEEHRGLDLN